MWQDAGSKRVHVRTLEVKMSRRALISSLFLLFLAISPLIGAEALPTVADKTVDLERMEGLLTVYLDRMQGQVWLQLPPAPAGEDGWSFI